MVNNDSSNFQEAIDNKYVILNALKEPGIIKWWHGYGAFVDFTNAAAVAWWTAQVAPVLEIGVDGFKVDEKGNVFSSGPGGVWVFSKGGKRLGRIETGTDLEHARKVIESNVVMGW